MNEFLGFLGLMRNAGWVFLCGLFLLATGMLFFDRAARAPAAEQEETSKERRAA